MKTILKNKWHLHAPIGAVVMSVLLFLFTYSESLRHLEQIILAFPILFAGLWFFEWNQDRRLPILEKQTNKGFYGDIFAGLAGGLIAVLANVIGNYTFEIIVLLILLIAGAILEIYKRKTK